MRSERICEIMAEELHKVFPQAEAVSVPVADGGEGSVDAFLTALGGERVPIRVRGPLGEEMEAVYGILPGGVAVVETAACAGLPLVPEEKRDPGRTTTFGVGQMMCDAAARGCTKIIVGLGGSATNDAGAGAAAAAGVVFRDAAGEAFVPTGATLGRVASIDCSGLDRALREIPVVAMCDVDNPLYGENGAAAVFGPQKGAGPAQVQALDEAMRAFCAVAERDTGAALAGLPGGGAAGGMGAGMVCFFGAALQMGIETVLETVQFDRLLDGADLVLTGEGKLDSQSLRGKVVTGVARHAKKKGVPVVAVVGSIEDPVGPLYNEGVSAVFSTCRRLMDFPEAKRCAESNLRYTLCDLFSLCALQLPGAARSC